MNDDWGRPAPPSLPMMCGSLPWRRGCDWETFGWARGSWAKLSWKQRSREFRRKLRGRIPRNLTRDVSTEGDDGVEGGAREAFSWWAGSRGSEGSEGSDGPDVRHGDEPLWRCGRGAVDTGKLPSSGPYDVLGGVWCRPGLTGAVTEAQGLMGSWLSDRCFAAFTAASFIHRLSILMYGCSTGAVVPPGREQSFWRRNLSRNLSVCARPRFGRSKSV